MGHTGSCHCGAVVIEIEAPPDLVVHECNCSMCRRTGFLHVIVPADRFRLIKGAESLQTYMFNTGVAKHHFCKVCACRPYYVPRSNPDGFSVNARCLDEATIETITVLPFDGQNWEKNAAELAHLSKPASRPR